VWLLYEKDLYVVFMNEILRTSARKASKNSCKKDAMREVAVLFLHYDGRFGTDILIGSADSQRVHTVFQHPAAYSQESGGMSLDVVGSFKGIQYNFSFEFHHGLLERQPSSERVIAEGRGAAVVLENAREMFGGDGVGSLGPNKCLLNDVLHFSNIAGPGIAGQKFNGIF
jgi:hypothetical protein